MEAFLYRHKTYFELAALFLVVLAVMLPFSAKPVHQDGIYFLRLAEHKLQAPLSDSLPEYGFAGIPHGAFRDTHPPLTSVWLAGVILLTGSADVVVLHLSFLAFGMLAAAGSYFLARRFARDHMFAAMLLLTGPAFVVMASDLMSDLPVTAFWLCAVAAFVYGVDRGSRTLLWVSALLMALALFSAYEALALIPLLTLYAFISRKPARRHLWPLAAAAAAFLAYIMAQWLIFGELPRLSATGAPSVLGPGFERFFPKSVSVLLALGGTFLFPLCAVAAFWPRTRRGYADFLLLTGFFVIAPLLLAFEDLLPLGQAAQMSVLLPAGALILWGTLEGCILPAPVRGRKLQPGARRARLYGIVAPRRWLPWRSGSASWRSGSASWGSSLEPRLANRIDRDRLFLAAWLLGVVLYVSIILFHASVKYLLPTAFPVAALIAGQARARLAGGRRLLVFQAITIAATLMLSLLVGAADYQQVAAYQDFARSRALAAPADDTPTTWFTGEFGFRFAMEEAGYQYVLTDDDRPAPGDTVIEPYAPGPADLGEELGSRLTLTGEEFIEGALPLRTISTPAGAGFYGHRWGLLPYSFSFEPLDHIFEYRVEGICATSL